MTGQNLAYVALVVQDAEAAAAILDKELGLTRTDCKTGPLGQVPVFGVGRTALALLAPEDRFLDGSAKPGVHHSPQTPQDPRYAEHARGTDRKRAQWSTRV